MNPSLLAVLRLSKEGFGSPVEIQKWPVGIVLAALNFSSFAADYEAAYIELNKPS